MKRKMIPAAVGLAGALGAAGVVSSISAAPVAMMNFASSSSESTFLCESNVGNPELEVPEWVSCTLTAAQISNSETNCNEGSLVNCMIGEVPKVQCASGTYPTGVEVTFGPAEIISSLNAENNEQNPSCFNVVSVAHSALDFTANSLSASLLAANSQGSGQVEDNLAPWCVEDWAEGNFKFYIPAGGVIDNEEVLRTSLVTPPSVTTYGPGNAEFGTFYRALSGVNPSFPATLSGRAGTNEQTSGTFESGIVTAAVASVRVEAVCAPVPALSCAKSVSPKVINTPDGEAEAVVTILKSGETALSLVIDDTMDEGMDYRTGSAEGDVTNDPLQSGRTFTWEPDMDAANSELAFSYMVDVAGLEDGDTICNSVEASSLLQVGQEGEFFSQTISTPESCESCLSFRQVLSTLSCEKTLSPAVFDQNGDAQVTATVSVTISDNLVTDNVDILDTLGTEMSYVADSSSPLDPTTDSPPQVGWTWAAPGSADPQTLVLTYDVDITGLDPDQTVCNAVTVTADGAQVPATCFACVTRPVAPELPTISALGLGIMALGLSGLGLLMGFRRRS